jgi:putative NADH-flavin reductase
LVEQALARGHEVTAFVRDPARLGVQHECLRYVQGDVRDPAKVAEAVQGQDAVLIALGPQKPAFDTMRIGAKHIVGAMNQHGVRRLVTLTGAGVPDPNDRPGPINHIISFLLKRIAPQVLEDASEHVRQVCESGLDWTIVRVPVQTDAPSTGRYKVGYIGQGPGIRVSRADVAAFMLDQLSDSRWLRKAPVIGG